MTRAGVAAVLLLVATGSCGCSFLVGSLLTPRLRECRGFDVPLTTLLGTSHKELRVRVRARRIDHDVPFVVESSPENLVLVGFTPLGTKAFTLVRTGDDVELENFVGPGIPVPPRNIMEDVLAMSVPSPCADSPDGTAVVEIATWHVRDECVDRRPVKRRLYPIGRRARAAAEAAAETAAPPAESPSRPAAPLGPDPALSKPLAAPQAPDSAQSNASAAAAATPATKDAGAPPDATAAASKADTAAADEADTVRSDAAADPDASTAEGEADAQLQDDKAASAEPEPEIEVAYTGDGITVQQNRCRYRARYVLQASKPVDPDGDASDEVEDATAPEGSGDDRPDESTPAAPPVSGEAPE